MSKIGYKQTKEHKKKRSISLNGRHCSPETEFKKGHQFIKGGEKNWFKKGIHLSPETEFKKGLIPWNKGRTGICSKETLKKISEAAQKRKVSKATRKKMSENSYWRGKSPHNKGKSKYGIIRCMDCGKILKTKNAKRCTKCKNIFIRGENSWSWQGGKSFEPYSLEWTKSLRISIRKRDKYTCKICSEKQGDRAFSIHHIDYNKLNCNPNNLITLCVNCHTKTNYKRKYWIKYFLTKLCQKN